MTEMPEFEVNCTKMFISNSKVKLSFYTPMEKIFDCSLFLILFWYRRAFWEQRAVSAAFSQINENYLYKH